MTRKLNEADRAAVDMIFDRLNADGAGSASYIAMTAAVDEARMGAVENVLKLLNEMPTPEPSADLAVRTLQRIAAAAPNAAIPAMPQYMNPNQPMA